MIQSSLQPRSLNLLLTRIRDVSTLPQVAMRLMRMGENATLGAAELCSVVESDPALSARVLRCVNSVVYGLRYRIDNLQRAVAHLGCNTVRSLAITAHVSRIFQHPFNHPPYTRAGLWRHSLAVAVASRSIALRTGMGDPEQAFLGGLLHDMGIILEDQYDHDTFKLVLDTMAAAPSLMEAERPLLGFTHVELGRRMAERWQFPEYLIDAIGYHHRPSVYRGNHAVCVSTVHLANVICSAVGITSVGLNLVPGEPEALTTLGLSPHDLIVLGEDLPAELNRHQELLTLQP